MFILLTMADIPTLLKELAKAQQNATAAAVTTQQIQQRLNDALRPVFVLEARYSHKNGSSYTTAGCFSTFAQAYDAQGLLIKGKEPRIVAVARANMNSTARDMLDGPIDDNGYVSD